MPSTRYAPATRLLRLDVHVAGPRIEGFQQDFVDQPDHGRFLGHLRQLGAVGFHRPMTFHLVAELIHHSLDGFAAHAEVGFDQLGDFLAAGQDRDDGLPGDRAQLIQGIEVEGVAGGDDQGAVFLTHRKHRLAMDELLREGLQQREVDVGIGQFDVVQAHLFPQRPQRSFLGDEAHVDGHLVEPLAIGLGRAGDFQLTLVEEPLSQQYFTSFHDSTLRPRTGSCPARSLVHSPTQGEIRPGDWFNSLIGPIRPIGLMAADMRPRPIRRRASLGRRTIGTAGRATGATGATGTAGPRTAGTATPALGN